MSGLQLPSGDDNLGELNRNRPLHPSLYTLSTSQPLFPHSTPHQLTSCETATRPIDNRPRVQAPFVGLVHLSSPLPLLANHHSCHYHRTSPIERLGYATLHLWQGHSVPVMHLLHFQAVLHYTRHRRPQCGLLLLMSGFDYFVSRITFLVSHLDRS